MDDLTEILVPILLFINNLGKNQYKESHQREAIDDIRNLTQKKSQVGLNIYTCIYVIYVLKDFCTFSLVTKNVNSRSIIVRRF